jgi:Spy/CpxP family protein refolding chaperone
MKKILYLLAFGLVVNISAFAQQGGGQRRSVEERVKMTLDRMKETLQITPEQTVKLDSVFTKSFKDMEKAREDARTSGNRMDRDAFMKFSTERDEKVKSILTDEQFKKYKAEEEARRQRMGNRGGGSN